MAGFTPKSYWNTIRRARLIRVLLVFLGASFVVLEAVDILTEQLGLPDWVFPGALVLLLIGLPIIMATALAQAAPHERRDALSLDVGAPLPEMSGPGESPAPTEAAMAARRWLTWRKAIIGGVLAFALLGVAVTGYMVMRVLGIGPVGSLVAAGALDPGARIMLADFENNTSDPLLGGALVEALRVDLAQSPLVSVVDPAFVSAVLRRMERPADAPLDETLAREAAVREGIRAVLAGEINSVGTGYVLSARLVSAETGEAFVSFRETAKDSTAIIEAIDRLSKDLRERIGESLKTIRSSEPIERVTTGSLEALRKYSQAERALHSEGDSDKGIALLEEAVSLDTTFAMAWRKLGVALLNLGIERTRQVEALTKAFEYRARLTDRERYQAMAIYYWSVTGEADEAITAYRTLLDTYPNDTGALNNLGLLYRLAGRYEQAEEMGHRALALDSLSGNHYFQVISPQLNLGKLDEAAATVERMAEKLPGNPSVNLLLAAVAYAREDYQTAQVELAAMAESGGGSALWRASSSPSLARLSATRGKLARAEQHQRDAMAANEELGLPEGYLSGVVWLAGLEVWFRGSAEGGLRRVEAALDRYPLDSIAPLNRPYLELARLYARAGRPEDARRLVNEYEESIPPELRRADEPEFNATRGALSLADGRYADAIQQLRLYEAGNGFCVLCPVAELGRAYDLAGEADSAIAFYERYVSTPDFVRMFPDARHLAFAYERLAALYEERGEAEKAIYYHGRLVELWSEADPELQPRVEAARRDIAALAPDR